MNDQIVERICLWFVAIWFLKMWWYDFCSLVIIAETILAWGEVVRTVWIFCEFFMNGNTIFVDEVSILLLLLLEKLEFGLESLVPILYVPIILIFLYLLWFLIVITSVIVVFVKHPIHSILALIAVFIQVGILLLFVNLDYIAFVFLVVYVGAIAVLFLFVTMMLNIRQLELNISILAYLPATIFIILSFFTCFYFLFILVNTDFSFDFLTQNINVVNTFYALTNIEAIGNCLYTYFYVAFIASAVILLVAMIGSISLTLYQKANIKRQLIDKQWLRDFIVFLKK